MDEVLAAGIRIPSLQKTVEPRISITFFNKTVKESVLLAFLGVLIISGTIVSTHISIICPLL